MEVSSPDPGFRRLSYRLGASVRRFDGALFAAPRNDHDGSFWIAPPFRADSWARMPTQVMFADSTAFGYGSRPSTSAETISWARWGWEPPWPPPCANDRWVFSARS